MSDRTPPTQEMLGQMLGVLSEHQPFERKTIPVTSNWASKIGTPCERQLFYWRKDWDKADARDWKGIGIRGNLIADWWKRYMMEKGFKIIHDQLPLTDDISKKYKIGGRIDGKIGWQSLPPILYEFKTVSPHYYFKINSYEDFARMKPEYLHNYPAQIQIYLMAYDQKVGLMILCNPETLEWKAIPVHVDLDYVQELVAKADRTNVAVDNDAIPPRIPYGKTCAACDFKRLCLPDIENEGIDFYDEEYMLQLAGERHQLKPARDRYEEVDEELKDLAKARGKDFILSDEFKFELKKSIVKRLDAKSMPENIKAPYMKESEQIRVEITPLLDGN